MVWIAESYAKINLGLHVLERLPTGYHRIETGFCFLEWSDRFEVKSAETTTLELSDDTIPTNGSNLIIRAISALKRYIGLKQAYHIKVKKNIPPGAGLGGGSSNAALILRMINKIETLGLSNEDLVDLSRDLGADIPFFISGKTGIANGIGDKIEEIDIQPGGWIVTAFPNETSSTAEAYQECDPDPDPEFPLKNVLTQEPIEEWKYLLINNLERPVFQRLAVTGNLKDQMYEFGAVYASMTGSGSAVYGIFEQHFVALDAYKTLIDLGLKANLTRPGFTPDYGIYRKE
jgi:4-diphosphocytidyl-2-C-methyl-D-erythritol kinase